MIIQDRELYFYLNVYGGLTLAVCQMPTKLMLSPQAAASCRAHPPAAAWGPVGILAQAWSSTGCRGICAPGAWSSSSLSFFHYCVCRDISLTFSHSWWAAYFLPFHKYVIIEVPQALLNGSVLGSGGTILKSVETV